MRISQNLGRCDGFEAEIVKVDALTELKEEETDQSISGLT